VSANIRGFHTNVGELTHAFVLKNKADIIFVCETFLDDKVSGNYAKIPGYSPWIRKDRNTSGGGIALCHRNTVPIQVIDYPVQENLELILWKIIDGKGKSTLCCGCYRPPSQGTIITEFLINHLDNMLSYSQCENLIIVGDLNQHTIQANFDSMLALYDLTNHVNFATHSSGSSLDPVVTNFPEDTVRCSPLGFVGTSDHIAVLTTIAFTHLHEENYSRTLWKWEYADWRQIRKVVTHISWKDILKGDVNQQVEQFTSTLHDIQEQWVPHAVHISRPSDQPWFGPRCRMASDEKYKAWINFKRNPTDYNKALHRQAAAHMVATQKWAIRQWEKDTKNKLKTGQVGSKQWWTLVKEKQGETREGTIPPITTQDGTMALTSQQKAEVLAQHFAQKMTVVEPDKPAPMQPVMTQEKLTKMKTTKAEVERILKDLNESKAVGPDEISPRLLKRCSKELSNPVALLFNNCIQQGKWPSKWKLSHVVPIHKKGNKSEVKNYRPVALLSAVNKILEKIIGERLTEHLNKHNLMCSRQFGFKKKHSAADLHLLSSSAWSSALDRGQSTAVVALDIEGAFDRVWHGALVEKLRGVGVDGALLSLLTDYLTNRHLSVVLNGNKSSQYAIRAGVPQGSVLGPLLWNIFINDLLHLVPVAQAFADDITLSVTYNTQDEAVTATRLNNILQKVLTWGNRWQVKFAPNKTHLMVITRTLPTIKLYFDGKALQPQDEIEILGVSYDKKLTFKTHIENIVRKASRKIASLRRISWLLDAKGREVLYKAQIRSVMEYAPLTWGGAAKKHLDLLDRVQARASSIISGEDPRISSNLQNLQHRRDVAGLTVMFKIQTEQVPHLQPLRQPVRRMTRTTRTVERVPEALEEPHCRTWHYQRQFIPKYTRMWNTAILSCVSGLAVHSIQSFKTLVNAILSSMS